MNEERLRRLPNVGIVGASSLLGKELKEQLEAGGFPLGRLTLLETEEYAGLLQEFAGDIQITQIISPETLSEVDIAFFTCSPTIMDAFVASGAAFPELTIDLTQRGRPGALFLSGLSDTSVLRLRGYYVNPHPSVIVMARVLSRLHNTFGLRSASVTVLESASDLGNAGVDELQDQTLSLLNFQNFEHKVFGGQIAFNVLRAEDRFVGQLAELLGQAFPKPMVQSVHVPVFHGQGFSIFADLLKRPERGAVRESLAADSSFVMHGEDEPTPVGVVGTHGIHIGKVQESEEYPERISLWVAADNLRLSASNAIRTAENLMLAAIGDRS